MANIYKSKNNDISSKQNDEPFLNWNNENDDKKYNLNASNSKLNFVKSNHNEFEDKNSFYNMNIGSK